MFVYLLFAICGCAGTMQTARTNGAGKWQLGVEPGLVAHKTDHDPNADSEIKKPRIGNVEYYPYLNLSTRYGVSDRVDLGLRLGVFRYEIQSKFMISDPNEKDDVALSFAPSVVFGAEGAISLNNSILAGIPIGETELVISPRALIGTDDSRLRTTVGGSLGWAIPLGSVKILPEFNIDVPVIGTDRIFDGVLYNIGIGLLFGGR